MTRARSPSPSPRRRRRARRPRWEVTAGLISGEVLPEHTRRWALTAAEWKGGKGVELFLQREALATAYARYLQVAAVNWTRLDFVWVNSSPVSRYTATESGR